MLILTNAHAEDAKWDCGRDDESGKFRLALHTPIHGIELVAVTGLSHASLADLVVAVNAALQDADRQSFRDRLEKRLDRLAAADSAKLVAARIAHEAEFCDADGTPAPF